MYTTGNLIKSNLLLTKFKVDESIADIISSLSTEYGYKNYSLYYHTYIEYKRLRWFYDMEDGYRYLMLKIYFNKIVWNNIPVGFIVREICRDMLSMNTMIKGYFKNIKWIKYPFTIESLLISYTKKAFAIAGVKKIDGEDIDKTIYNDDVIEYNLKFLLGVLYLSLFKGKPLSYEEKQKWVDLYFMLIIASIPEEYQTTFNNYLRTSITTDYEKIVNKKEVNSK